jgi:hypothetical protein
MAGKRDPKIEDNGLEIEDDSVAMLREREEK